MKNICFVLLLLSQVSVAQNLSGSIKYDVKYTMDARNKEQMEKFGMMMPNQMEILSNGVSAKMKMGSAAGTMMEILHTSGGSYMLDSRNKKAYKMEERDNPMMNKGKATVTKTEEFETIAGHKARKYIIEAPGKKEMIWATPDYKISPALLANMNRRGITDNSYMKELDGVPLKIITEERGNTIEMTAVKIDESKPDESNFTLPADYKVEPFSPAAMGMMMGGGAPPKR